MGNNDILSRLLCCDNSPERLSNVRNELSNLFSISIEETKNVNFCECKGTVISINFKGFGKKSFFMSDDDFTENELYTKLEENPQITEKMESIETIVELMKYIKEYMLKCGVYMDEYINYDKYKDTEECKKMSGNSKVGEFLRKFAGFYDMIFALKDEIEKDNGKNIHYTLHCKLSQFAFLSNTIYPRKRLLLNYTSK